MVRKALGGVMFVMLLAASAGCGGYSEEKAQSRCDQEQFAKAQCMTDAVYAECVACFKECGDSCEPRATCPESYTCDDAAADTGADTSTDQ